MSRPSVTCCRQPFDLLDLAWGPPWKSLAVAWNGLVTTVSRGPSPAVHSRTLGTPADLIYFVQQKQVEDWSATEAVKIAAAVSIANGRLIFKLPVSTLHSR